MTKHYDYDYALMSDFVYKLGDYKYKIFLDKNESEYENQKKELENRGWKRISTSQDYKIGTDVDYFGATFEHKITKEIVIAHRGTIFNSNGHNPNIIEDVKIFFGETPYLILNPCVDYIKEAFIKTKPNIDTKITMTGHSLGGYLAGASTAALRGCTNYQNIKAVTFDSIGIKSFLDKFKKDLNKQQIATAKLNNIEDNILNYLSSPNKINTMVEHIGETLRLYLENDLTDSIRESALSTYKDIKEENIKLWLARFFDAITTFQFSHPMTNFLSAFDKEGGFPKGNYGKITQWPSGNYGFFDREPKYTSTNYIEDKYEKSFQKPFKLMKTPEFIEQKIRPVMNSMIPMIPIFGLLFNVNTDRQSEDEYSSEEANNINLNP